jgi:hypothetical protein
LPKHRWVARPTARCKDKHASPTSQYGTISEFGLFAGQKVKLLIGA